MTTQPSDWAVARAFWELSDKLLGTPEDALYFSALLHISERARELDASGGGPDDAMAMHWIDRYAAGLDEECQLDRIREALSTPRAAEAGDMRADTIARLESDLQMERQLVTAWHNRFVSQLTEQYRHQDGMNYEMARLHAETRANEFAMHMRAELFRRSAMGAVGAGGGDHG